MPLIAITRLRVRAWRFLPLFFIQVLRTGLQARKASGSLAVTVLREANRTFWTYTLWTDEPAMRAYMSAGAHRQVMRNLAKWCDEASVAQWIQESSDQTSWQDVHLRMQKLGRTSRVNHPTQAHRAFQIPPPRVRRAGVLRFK
jgi:heme-degrading monooxygenase HmoA